MTILGQTIDLIAAYPVTSCDDIATHQQRLDAAAISARFARLAAVNRSVGFTAGDDDGVGVQGPEVPVLTFMPIVLLVGWFGVLLKREREREGWGGGGCTWTKVSFDRGGNS